MFGIIAAIAALVLLHKSASTQTPTTQVSVGVPIGLGATPVPQRGGLVRDPGQITQTWQNWQSTTGTPVHPGSAQDVLAPATAASDAKINQQAQLAGSGGGLTVINPNPSGGGAGQTSTSVPGIAASASASPFTGGGGSLHCPIDGTTIETIGPSAAQIMLLDETDWTVLETDAGHVLTASSSHLLYTRRGLVQLSTLTLDDYVVTNKGESRVALVSQRKINAKKMSIHVPDGHLYWAAGILSHNKAIIS